MVAVTGGARAQSGGYPSGAGESTSPIITQGRGIKLGEPLVLHLGISVDVAYDTNVFYQSTNTTDAFVLRVYPQFVLTNRPRQGPRMVSLDFRGGLGYIEYLTTDPALSGHRQFNIDAGLLASFFSASPYNFTIFDNYIRTVQPPYTKTSNNFNRDTNQVGARINLSPGGGRLTFSVGYMFGIDYFESAPLTDYDLQYHRFDLRVSWRFLPKTAVYIAADETIDHYPHPGYGNHADGYPFHVMAGLQGLITTKLTLNVWAGYGNGFYGPRPTVTAGAPPVGNPSNFIGGIALTWKPTLLSTGEIGYKHDFENSLLGTYYDVDTPYISWMQQIWRFVGFVRLQYSNMRFNGVDPTVQATTNGTDNFLVFNARLDYPFKPWLIASIGNDLYYNRSSRMLIGTPGAPGTVPVDFTKDVVFIRFTVSY